jgi:hypothetical protein
VTLVVGLSSRRPKTHLEPVNMGSDVEKLKLGAFLFHVIRFTRVGAIPLTYHTCPFAGLSLRSRRIDTNPVRMRFLLYNLTPGHVFLFSPVSIIPLIFHSLTTDAVYAWKLRASLDKTLLFLSPPFCLFSLLVITCGSQHKEHFSRK